MFIHPNYSPVVGFLSQCSAHLVQWRRKVNQVFVTKRSCALGTWLFAYRYMHSKESWIWKNVISFGGLGQAALYFPWYKSTATYNLLTEVVQAASERALRIPRMTPHGLKNVVLVIKLASLNCCHAFSLEKMTCLDSRVICQRRGSANSEESFSKRIQWKRNAISELYLIILYNPAIVCARMKPVYGKWEIVFLLTFCWYLHAKNQTQHRRQSLLTPCLQILPF